MKNRSIILTAILSLLVCGGLSSTLRAAGSAPVTVTNTTTNPVPIVGTVQTTENPARQAVQWNANMPFTGEITATSITIPAGKIFVLEFVSFFVNPRNDDFVRDLSIQVTGNLLQGGQGSGVYGLVIPPPDALGKFHGSQAIRLYAQPGTSLQVAIVMSNFTLPVDVQFGATVWISGYLVNAQ